MNPILPLHHYVPDVEAHQWADGRMYIYGSYDIGGREAYCSDVYHVFSSSDLLYWKDHGVSFRSGDFHSCGEAFPDRMLYAPDCIFYNGVYYLYFCKSDGSEGVAMSSSPSGPFVDAKAIAGADGDAIDPAAFVDDDGKVYYYWGQFHARGACMKPGMAEIDPNTLHTELLTEKEHGFHEGVSVRKRNGIYYLIYTDISRGKATCISYATSESPLGPFVKGGVIIDNTGCDSETWNNHGSIAEFNGKWYVFYHRSSRASKFNRRACIEPISFCEDGSIPEVEMTTQGISGPLDARIKLEAWRACLLSGNVRTEAADVPGEVQKSEILSSIKGGDWAAFKYINFGRGVSEFYVKASSTSEGGCIEIRIGSIHGDLIGRCEVLRTGGFSEWKTFSCPVHNATDVQAVYLLFRGGAGRLFNIESFRFE